IASEDVLAFNTLVTKARARDESTAGELRVRSGQRPTVIRLTACRQPQALDTLLLAFEDISERRAADERLVATERELREANHRKDEFLAMLSHELRNPLAPIRT